ncbi:uncharacterized protein BJX67DRAFT_317514 [Aspergillus lucknowensis]|uniref:RNase III domain-containing protein n=1 Tax=Aspergillus lucknowensis TaxID=176173 RepID=A0ABR4LC93_9EURO
MVTHEHIRTVETVIGYIFTQRWLIRQALTAAGAEEHNYDGNRQLSQLGASLMDTILAILVYNTGVNRAQTNFFEQRALFYHCQTDWHRSMHQKEREDCTKFPRSPS